MRHFPSRRLYLLPPCDHNMLLVPKRRMLAPCLAGSRRLLMGSLAELLMLGASGLNVSLRGEPICLGLRGPGLNVSSRRLRRGSSGKLLMHPGGIDLGPALRRGHGRPGAG